MVGLAAGRFVPIAPAAGTFSLVVVAGEDAVDLAGAVTALHQRGLTRILCEGGPGLLRDVAAAGVLDELCLTVSPQLRAGPAPRLLAGDALDLPQRMALTGVLVAGDDLFLRYARG